MYRQRNNVNREYKNRPHQGGTQMFNQKTNIAIQKKESDRNNNRMWAPSSMHSNIPSNNMYGKVRDKQHYNQDKIGSDRINGELLSAFKNNPYTQSLQSCA